MSLINFTRERGEGGKEGGDGGGGGGGEELELENFILQI